MIRLAEMQDIPAILSIFDQAREFMRIPVSGQLPIRLVSW